MNKTYNFSVHPVPTFLLRQASVDLGLGCRHFLHLPLGSHLHAAPLQTVLQSQTDHLPLISQRHSVNETEVLMKLREVLIPNLCLFSGTEKVEYVLKNILHEALRKYLGKPYTSYKLIH